MDLKKSATERERDFCERMREKGEQNAYSIATI